MQEDITLIQEQASSAIAQSRDVAELDAIRVSFLGKKGKLTDILKGVSSLPVEQRPVVGQQINKVKRIISEQIEDRLLFLKEERLKQKISQEHIDVTLPGRTEKPGNLHPVSRTIMLVARFIQFCKLNKRLINIFTAWVLI